LVVAQRLRRHRAQFGDAPLEMGLPAQQPERQRERRQRPAPQQRQQGLVQQVALQQGAVEVDALGDAGLVARRARSHAGTVWITRSVPHSDAPGSARLAVAIVPSAFDRGRLGPFLADALSAHVWVIPCPDGSLGWCPAGPIPSPGAAPTDEGRGRASGEGILWKHQKSTRRISMLITTAWRWLPRMR